MKFTTIKPQSPQTPRERQLETDFQTSPNSHPPDIQASPSLNCFSPHDMRKYTETHFIPHQHNTQQSGVVAMITTS